jgi:nitric oxide reductase NorE protein
MPSPVERPADGMKRANGDLPGDEGVWFFVIADMAMFAVFFLLFMVGQAQDPETYRQSRGLLDPMLGLLNTLILLISGWWIVRAVEAARQNHWALARRRVIIALTVGLGFAIVKIFGYAAKIRAGIGLTTNEFFTYYFAFTGIHFLHFVVGIGVLLAILARIGQDGNDSRLRWLEAGATYWHMVDLLWLLLFPMLYLAGGIS